MTGIGKIRAVSVFCCILALVFMRCSPQPTQDLREAEDAIFRIDETVNSIEDLLSGMKSMIAALANPPKIADGCTVEFASYGLDDPTKFCYIRTTGGSSEEFLTPHHEARGVTLVELDATTCRTRNRQRFDTYLVADDSMQLVETIESAATGTIIVGVTADSAVSEEGHFRNTSVPIFTKYNMNIKELYSRDKFAFIMQKGYPKKTVFEIRPKYQESIRMKVQLYGSSVSEVNFKRL